VRRLDDQGGPWLIALASPCQLRFELSSIPRQTQGEVGSTPLVGKRLGAEACGGRLPLPVACGGGRRSSPRRDVADDDDAARGEHRGEPPPQLTRHLELLRPHAAKNVVQPRAIQMPNGGSETGAGRALRILARHRERSESTPTPAANASR